eukprot:scaffold281517_cov36-Tisochrysis_lutea.AAC.2
MVPICSNHHWTLAVINIKDKRFEYYDSLYGSDNHVLNTLRRYVADEHQARAHAAHTAPEEGGGGGGAPIEAPPPHLPPAAGQNGGAH